MNRLQNTLQQFWDRHQREIHRSDFGITSDLSQSILLVDQGEKKLTYIQMQTPDDVISEIPFADVKAVKFYPDIDEKISTETPSVNRNNSLLIQSKNLEIVMVITPYDYSKFKRYYQHSPPEPKRRTPSTKKKETPPTKKKETPPTEKKETSSDEA